MKIDTREIAQIASIISYHYFEILKRRYEYIGSMDLHWIIARVASRFYFEYHNVKDWDSFLENAGYAFDSWEDYVLFYAISNCTLECANFKKLKQHGDF